MLLNVTKTINIFLEHFHFLKKLQIFLMLLGITHAAPHLPKYPLISSYKQQKTFGQKLAKATSQNDFNHENFQ